MLKEQTSTTKRTSRIAGTAHHHVVDETLRVAAMLKERPKPVIVTVTNGFGEVEIAGYATTDLCGLITAMRFNQALRLRVVNELSKHDNSFVTELLREFDLDTRKHLEWSAKIKFAKPSAQSAEDYCSLTNLAKKLGFGTKLLKSRLINAGLAKEVSSEFMPTVLGQKYSTKYGRFYMWDYEPIYAILRDIDSHEEGRVLSDVK